MILIIRQYMVVSYEKPGPLKSQALNVISQKGSDLLPRYSLAAYLVDRSAEPITSELGLAGWQPSSDLG